ncbi:hypothetical protein GH714_008557 [Hevea brasiliensis]|uniref:Retrotransposon gag domain-containing protein n=1 Tax=Hevea brasiliensis TaxID=3981 RepID=A0A6A6LWQ2_HEVBR|nr:hypothetical protein GH714_008557 [Hevea brasiliensis]
MYDLDPFNMINAKFDALTNVLAKKMEYLSMLVSSSSSAGSSQQVAYAEETTSCGVDYGEQAAYVDSFWLSFYQQSSFVSIVLSSSSPAAESSGGQCRPKYGTSTSRRGSDQELPEGGDEHDVTVSHDVVSGAYPAAPPLLVPLVATVALPVPPADLGAFMAQVVTTTITAKPKDPWEVLVRARRLGAYDFEDRMDNIHGLLQGKADSWFAGIHPKIGADLTWDRFVIEFHQENLIESYKKESKMPSSSYFKVVSYKYHDGKCRRFDRGCFESGAPRHFKRDCPLLVTKDSGSGYGSVTPQNPHIGIAPT